MTLPRLLPKPSQNHPPPEPQIPSKRKRGLGHTACKHCRERRAKCSGERPTCETCVRLEIPCVYEAPEGVTRHQASKQKLADVERTSSNLLDVVNLLRHGTEADAAIALDRIRRADKPKDAVVALATAQALVNSTYGTPSSATRVGSPPIRDSPTRPAQRMISPPNDHPEYMFEKDFPQTRNQYLEKDLFIDVPAQNLPVSRWTTACRDNRLLNHIMSLFWTWDNNVTKTLYRPLFEEDLMNADSRTTSAGGHIFCSQFLVNAVLALGCLFTSEQQTFADSEDVKTRGRRFADEADVHYASEKSQPSIPLLQGQFALFIYEGMLGIGTKSVDYFMSTMETYEQLNEISFLHPQSREKSKERLQNEENGLSWIMWGLYCAEWRATQAFGFRKLIAKPLVAKLWRNSTFPLCQTSSTCHWWFPYPMSLRMERSMKVEIREVDCYLSDLADQVLDFLYPLPDSPSGPPTTNPQHALMLYNELVQLKFSLPSRLRLEEAVLPSTILLHSHVEVLLIGVLRPFAHVTKAQFGPFDPKDRAYQHCMSLMDSIWTFRAFGNINCEYWYVHTIATVAFMTFREHADSPVYTENLIKACKCLHEMTNMFPLAEDTLSAIRGAFKMANMQLPSYVQPFLDARFKHRHDGLLHHAAAQILPSEERLREARRELRYQELLDELDGVGLD